MNPDPFSFAELAWMAEGKQRDEWDRWSFWIAIYANSNRSEDSEVVLPSQYNPFERHRKRQPTLGKTDSVKHLSALFGAKKG